MSKANIPTILIIDDTPTNIQILAEALRTDYRVKVAGSGAVAFEIIGKQGAPDLVLLDLMMPGMDGYEICQRLKEEEITKNIPVIFITAKTNVQDEERGLRLGAVDYITKPFHIPIVLARVRNHIALKLQSDLLETHALLDGLTHIPNRRRFDQVLESEWKRAQRSTRGELALVMLDIDHFKLFNDHQGHSAGDICLRKVAETLESVIRRDGDLIARYGGEEFAALLPETDLAGATRIAENFCTVIETLHIPHQSSSTSQWVTCSIGVASMQLTADNVPIMLIKTADQRLYQAKKLGRNRVCCVDDSEN